MLSAALAVLVFGGSAALAHYVYQEGNVYDNGNSRCLQARGEISHGNGGGYAKSTGRSFIYQDTHAGRYCNKEKTVDPQHLANRNVLLKWRSAQKDWAVCVNGDWNYNSKTSAYNNKTSVYSTPCSSGWYANNAGAFVYINSNWRGGYVWSGEHNLPT